MRCHTSITTSDIDEVFKKLAHPSIRTSPELDIIHPCILEECADSLTVPLMELFRRLFNEMHVPVDWKNANMLSIINKGDETIVLNYRKVSLTSVISKAFESIIKDHLISYLLDNDFICVQQFGFMLGRSTCL